MAGLPTSLRVDRLLSRSQTLLEHHQPKDAEPLCREAVALAPQSTKAWLYLSWIYLDLDRPAEALDASEHALSINSRSDWAWKNKGIALNQSSAMKKRWWRSPMCHS